MKIVASYQGWWIDNRGRRHDEWWVVDEDSYDGPGSPMGTGNTEQEAREHLQDQLDELEEKI